jgi:opacity protein-like surface antigen
VFILLFLGLLALPTAHARAADEQPADAANEPAAAQPPREAQPPDIAPEAYRWRLLQPLATGVTPRNPLYDPYSQNILKGDIPAIGDHLFFATTATLDAVVDAKRNLDFTRRDQFKNVPFHEDNLLAQLTGTLAMELFHGDTVFTPKDWAIRVTPIFRWRCGDRNAIDQGCGDDWRLLETFGEVKLFEIGNTFDPTSARLGLQIFNSDFFGFIYNDTQPGARIFSEIARNQFKANLAFFDRLNKEKLSGLDEFKRREHQVVVASFQWDDFIFPGFNILPNFVWSNDEILAGTLDAYYLGVTTNGHLGRVNVNSAFYYVFGDTAKNTLAKKSEDISAGMAFAQVAYPIAYWNPRVAVAWASGDGKPRDGEAHGFDSVFDNVAFGGGQFSYLFGEKIQLGNVTVLRGNSVFPSLRGANATSQFENPGVFAVNAGVDVAVTPRTLFEANYDYVRFEDTSSIEARLNRSVSTDVGHEVNGGFTYRPWLNDQLILFGGAAVFFPGQAIRDAFGTDKTAYKLLLRAVLTF